MSTIFIETVSKAVGDYRQMLRRYLSQSERVSKLSELNLKNPDYTDEVGLYHLAQTIVRDIEQNLNTTTKNYYSYSGVGNFCRYLKEFLSNYIVEDEAITHRAQKASRALIQSIQLLSLPPEKLTTEILEQINDCNTTIALFGSEEQCELYKENLERYYHERGAFFGPLLRQFEASLNQSREVSEAA